MIGRLTPVPPPPFIGDDSDMRIVSMLEFNGMVYVATEKGVYIIKNDKLHRLEIVEKKD